MKKIVSTSLALALALATLAPTQVYAANETTSADVAAELQIDANASPRFVYTYEKTVVNFYTSFADVPTEIYYEEYLEAWGWCRGLLKLQSVKKVNIGYEATYSGTMRSPNT